MQSFEEAKSTIMFKQYDYLNQRNADFDRDFNYFITLTDKLKESIGNVIEKNFDSVWETPQGIRFLTRFEKVSNLVSYVILNCMVVKGKLKLLKH